MDMKRYGPLPILILLVFLISFVLLIFVGIARIQDDESDDAATTPTTVRIFGGPTDIVFTVADLNRLLGAALNAAPDISNARIEPNVAGGYFDATFDVAVLGQPQAGAGRILFNFNQQQVLFGLDSVTLTDRAAPAAPAATVLDAQTTFSERAIPALNDELAARVNNTYVILGATLQEDGTLAVRIDPD